MMAISVSTWAELLVPALYGFVEVGMNRRGSLIPQIFDVRSSERAKEELIGVGQMGIDAFGSYAKSGTVGEIDFDRGYLSTFRHVDYPVRFTVPRSLIADGMEALIGGNAERLGKAAAMKRETDAAGVFNNAFSSSYLGPDGKALCVTDHPRSQAKGGSLSNKGTTAFTAAALTAAKAAMMKYPDDANNVIGVMPNRLLVPAELADSAYSVVNSAQVAGGANNDANPHMGMYTILTWAQLTDTNNWFLLDSVEAAGQLIWYDRQEPTIQLVQETSVEAIYEMNMRYSYGWADWRFVFGAAVA